MSASARRTPDLRRIGEAMAQPGIDTRYWLSYGEIAVVKDDGTVDTTDPQAVFIGPEGVECDVVLIPSDEPIVARYAGIHGGRFCTMYAPIRAGDLVVVGLPGGNTAGAVILAVLASSAHAQALGPGGVPIFDNKRLLVFAESVPVDIRTRGGARVLMEQSGKVSVESPDVRLGDGAASEPYVLGNRWKSFETTILTALMGHTHPGGIGPSADLTSFTGEINNLPSKLSTTIKGK